LSRRLPTALLASAALLAGGAAALAAPTAPAPLGLAPIEASLLDGGIQRGFVELESTATAADLRAIFATGVVKAHAFKLVPQVAVVAPSSAFRALAALPGVVRLQEDHGVKLDLDKSKAALGVPAARAPKPKGLGLTGKGVRVAVIDTGVDSAHPDFERVLHAYNTEFAWMTEPVQDGVYGQQAFELTEQYGGIDENGHGTHVASTVAGTGKGAKDAGLEEDMTGVAPGADLVTYKIAGASQTGADLGWEQNAMVAIEHIVEHEKELRIKVVSNSWSIYEVDDPDVEPTIQIIRAASRRGILFAFAASNDGPKDETVGWPGATGEVLTVASTVKTKPFGVSSFSSRGYQVDVAAPGSSITAARSSLASYTPESRLGAAAPLYASISGTSMATPHVAGVLALILEANPRLTPTQLNEVIERTVTDLGDTGKDHSYGYGFVDAYKAAKVALCLAKKPGAESCFTAQRALPKSKWKLDWDDKGNKSRTSQS
jgi:serine protease AprX